MLEAGGFFQNGGGKNKEGSRLLFGCTRVLAFMRAAPAVALSPFDAQLRGYKM